MLSFKWKHFKQDIILLLVRWYLAYALSYRDVEELLFARGVIVTYEAIRKWCRKFDKPIPISSGADGLVPAINGISMRSY